ncbi:hypothetical protein QBC40DRAFT_348184 [Triangularia verruculosa]|uniref:NACHT domain-containing protein n=1 Tax=Triangularia verruculosa TaxID=2587418 RepID=A0AAN6XHT5_9PEZI|nr:hypothetical protein QBC40DRAFT_348184 [Triangularia verruculosa]
MAKDFLRHNITHQQSSRTLQSLQSLRQDLAIVEDPYLNNIWDDVLRLTASAQAVKPQQYDSQIGDLTRRLRSFTDEFSNCQRTYQVIKSLVFVEIRRRFSLIPEAENSTNEWLMQEKTGFRKWLESGDGIFWVTGKAGSGKSTLMKFASEHHETENCLHKWAGTEKLHRGSFYFWNQGSELQKSVEGLLRTFLCQIFRHAPELVPKVCAKAPDAWTVGELRKTLEAVFDMGCIAAKFCFFIDGLDEYHGDEEDIAHLLSFLSRHHGTIKLCVSSRPRPLLDDFFDGNRKTLTISDHTKDDMRRYVLHRLQPNAKFQKFRACDPVCGEIISIIADIAKGVWLWVFLVTRDLVRAVNRNEGITKLREILDRFPEDLEAYFKFIIDGVHPIHKQDMARIFLITVEEVQPLPLFAFSLLEREKLDPLYAMKAPISPLVGLAADEVKVQKDRLHNRCSDLLIVDDGPHPVFLDHPVDFLHRTVRDYLRDCHYQQLTDILKSQFQPLVSLGHMMLFLLKGLPPINIQKPTQITRLIQIVDELLYYAHEAEKLDGSTTSPLAPILDEMDRVCTFFTAASMRYHWTHLRDMPRV